MDAHFDAVVAPVDAALGPPDAARPDDSSAAAEPTIDATLDRPDARLDAEPERKPELTFEVTTKPLGGSQYEPRNLLAIWVEDVDGAPIKVLGVWGGVMRRLLVRFGAQFPWINNTFATQPPGAVDVITAATQRAHGVRRATWNLTDTELRPVPDGRYAVVVEATDQRERSALVKVWFHKSDTAVDLSLPGSPDFGPITLHFDPDTNSP